MVKDVVKYNKFHTDLIGENRTNKEPAFDSNKCKKTDVTNYIEEGMRLIIDYPQNIFIWPVTKGDSNHNEDDSPVLWFSDEVCEDKVDLSGWESKGWNKENLGERYMQLNSLKSNLSEAKNKLHKILSMSLPDPSILNNDLTNMKESIDEYNVETYLKTLYYYGKKN